MKAYAIKRVVSDQFIGREMKEITLFPTEKAARFWLQSSGSGLAEIADRFAVVRVTLEQVKE